MQVSKVGGAAVKKGVCYFLFLALISAILVVPSLAHSGGTDANGGHWNRSTGEYHYHHGYPAHQHTNGVCLYDFDDKTGQSSGNSGKTNGSKPNSSAPSATTKSSTETKKNIGPVVGVGVVGLSVVGAVKYGRYQEERRKAEEARRMREELRRKKEEAFRKKYEGERARYLRLYGGKTRNELARIAGMPKETIIAYDNLPAGAAGIEWEKWGHNYTFYVSRSGKVFHATRWCNHAADIPQNAVRLGDRAPCKLCRPRKPDLKWYSEYRKILDITAEYKIEVQLDRDISFDV